MPAPEQSHADAVRGAIAELRRSAASLAPAHPAAIPLAESDSPEAVQREPSDPRLAADGGSDSARLIAALHATALTLSDARDPLAVTLRHELHAETGLSLPMIEWGLVTSLSSLRHAPLAELISALPAPRPHELIGVVLAGNVFVAAVRGIALPLLVAAHVIVKTSMREGALARAFQAALSRADPTLGARLAVVQFGREDHLATEALCTNVDALSVYGSDETVAQLRRIANCARIVAHGHGLSAAYVARSALQSSEHASSTAERVALDISAYDQRGCLSPHFVLVESGGAVEPQAFAQLLAERALPALASLLPAAEPDVYERAELLQWQATAAVRGDVYTHAAHSVSFEPAPLRPSPGGRHVGVYACAGHAQLRELLEPFATHLKCLGVAASKEERSALAQLVRGFSGAQVCRSGEMQTPAFDAWADGAPPLAGLFASTRVER